MGIQQAELFFGAEKTLASISSGATDTIGDIVNLGANRDFYDTARNNGIGKSGQMWLTILAEETFASGGSPSITIKLDTKASASSFSSGATTLVTISGVSKTTAAGTYIYQGPVPVSPAALQYVGINVTLATATLTAGKITAFLSLDADLNT